MAATTITRATWTDDSGSALDGTIINNDRLQDDIYAPIDELFAGGTGYETFTVGGLFATEGFGTVAFTAGGAGSQIVRVRNTSAGAGNKAVLQLGNDSAAGRGTVEIHPTTFTTSGKNVADGVLVDCAGAGGVTIAASHASGTVRMYAGGTLATTITADGMVTVAEVASTPANPTADVEWGVYAKGDKFILVFNRAGTPHYYYLDGTADSGTWTHTTSAP
jgi:hypothetical protein